MATFIFAKIKDGVMQYNVIRLTEFLILKLQSIFFNSIEYKNKFEITV